MIAKIFFVALGPDPALAVDGKMYTYDQKEDLDEACRKANAWAKRPLFSIYEGEISVKNMVGVKPADKVLPIETPSLALRDINQQLKKGSVNVQKRPARPPQLPPPQKAFPTSFPGNAMDKALSTDGFPPGETSESRERVPPPPPPQRRYNNRPGYTKLDPDFRDIPEKRGDTEAPHDSESPRYGRSR